MSEALEMVERVAAAIRDARTDNYPGDRMDFDVLARAAIEAMREPTDAMLEAFRSASADEWHAAIDEALK